MVGLAAKSAPEGCIGACAKRLFFGFGVRRGERRYNIETLH